MTKRRWINGGAWFSPCHRYRYWLDREVSMFDRTATFLMLNPSTATAETDDPTIRRCIGFARQWQCGRLIVVNIFAFRATLPADMRAEADPVGPDNDRAIRRAAQETRAAGGLLICAWGIHGKHRDRDRQVLKLLESEGVTPHALGLTADGSPRHPLYLRSDRKPEPYAGRAAS